MTLSELIFNKTKNYQNLDAIKFKEKSITYKQLNIKALEIASIIKSKGIFNDKTIAIITIKY